MENSKYEALSTKQTQMTFKNPGKDWRGAPFWSWNDKLEEAELRRQIREMKKAGMGGFFMHSRVGLITEYLSKEWIKMIKACVAEAKKTGMNAWLYDEDRWPSGAAGGLGAGLVAFCGAEIRSGASLVLETLRFEEYLKSADLILTGEGKIDRQIEFGKAISGVALLAEKYKVPVIALAGAVEEGPERLASRGIQGAMSIVPGPMSEEEAVSRASELLQEAAERTMRLLVLGRGLGEGRWLPT